MSMVPPDHNGPEEPMDVSPQEDFIYYLRLGHQLMDAGCVEEAKGAAERARELNPHSPRVENLLG